MNDKYSYINTYSYINMHEEQQKVKQKVSLSLFHFSFSAPFFTLEHGRWYGWSDLIGFYFTLFHGNATMSTTFMFKILQYWEE